MKRRFLMLTTLGVMAMAMSTFAGCGNTTATDSSSSAKIKTEVSVDDAKKKSETKTESTTKADVTDENVVISLLTGIDKTVVVKDAKVDDIASNFKDETGTVKELKVKNSTIDASKVGEYKVTYTATVYKDAFEKAATNVKNGKEVAKYTAKADDKTKDVTFDVTVKVVTEDDAKNLKDVLIINKSGNAETKDLTKTTPTEAATKTDSSTTKADSTKTDTNKNTGSSTNTSNSNGSSSSNKNSTGSGTSTNASNSTGGSSNSGGSSSGGSSQTATHTHNWQPVYTTVHHNAVYQTVHHDAVTHQEQVKVGENPIMEDHDFCDCGYDITNWTNEQLMQHAKEANCFGSYNQLVQVGTEPIYETQTITDQEAYDEQVLVQDAYDEQVISGYSCSCGATK